MKATVEIVRIGPKQAEEILTSQVKEQRHLRDSHVQTLAKDMTNGDFRLSADALVMIKGQLANGQHRMWAVIESKTTQPFLMMTTDDEELYKVLDCGLRRTVGDAAHVSCSTDIAAIAVFAMCYDLGAITPFNFNRQKKPSRSDVIDYIHKYNDDMQNALTTARALSGQNQNIAPRNVSAAMLHIASRYYGDMATSFMSQVYTGSNPESCTFDLRERFIKMRMSRGRLPSQYYLALMIKSFNCFVKGTRLGTLKMNDDEAFPKIIMPTKSAK